MSSNKLFVAEDYDEDPFPVSDDSGENKDVEMGDNEADNNESHNTADQKIEFSDEEIEPEMEDEDDSIVESYPLYLAGHDEHLHVLQYANRPKMVERKAVEHPIIAAARYKKKSELWELDIPLDIEAFYNTARAEDDWNGVSFQTLKGVSVPNAGQYAVFVHNNKLYLSPVETIAQMRPYFKYIDTATQKARNENKQTNNPAASQKAHVVTMSVKSVNDPTQNRLAGSLLAHKIADEEIPIDLQWLEGTFDQFKETIINESRSHKLKPIETKDDYVNKFFK